MKGVGNWVWITTRQGRWEKEMGMGTGKEMVNINRRRSRGVCMNLRVVDMGGGEAKKGGGINIGRRGGWW